MSETQSDEAQSQAIELTPSRALLDRIHGPADLRQLPLEDLQTLADQVRAEMIEAVSHTGGHLGAGLGVVELTVALHYVFDTPHDRLIWDVGHQSYPHKILTGRRAQMKTIRQKDGLSGFVRRSESEYDAFGTAHSSTSISAAYGMSRAAMHQGKDRSCISVIGDGAMTSGMAYEALNNVGAGDNSKMVIILNDNEMSISTPVGALSAYLSRLTASRAYLGLRGIMKAVAEQFPSIVQSASQRWEEMARTAASGGTMFEEMGLYYIGPIDGHNVEHLVNVLQNVRDSEGHGPFLVHVATQKGKGYAPAENSSDKYHGVAKFDVASGVQSKSAPKAPSYTNVFADALIKLASEDDQICAITAAMPSGTGLDKFGEQFPERTYDVGIAEQHAVTFAAGMACEGMKPFVAIYSTFLQRAYDQIVHDVSIQNLPVRFAMDRAGYVGADGQTHHGAFDLAYLCCLPNLVVAAPADEAELALITATAAEHDSGPFAFRYPRGNGVGVEIPDALEPLPIGKGRMVKADGKALAFLTLGSMLHPALEAAKQLDAQGLTTSVADARFAKPIDLELIRRLMQQHDVLVMVEEGSSGGFGAHALQQMAAQGLLDGSCKVISHCMPDHYIDHMTPAQQLEAASLDANGLAEVARKALGMTQSSGAAVA